MKMMVAVGAGFLALGAVASPVTNTVSTALCGDVRVVSDDPRGWKFALSSQKVCEGIEEVTVKISSAEESIPPEMILSFDYNGAKVRNVWTADYSKDYPRLWPALWNPWRGSSQLACEIPLTVAIDGNNNSHLAVACSDAFNKADFGIIVKERTGDLICRFRLFNVEASPRKDYSVKFRIDTRVQYFGSAVSSASEWICKTSSLVPAPVPEDALEPLYSTWYAYLQDVKAPELEREAKLAADLGMKTMILDDGWQKLKSKTFYSATGDWNPVPSRFPDMKAHVDAVHRAGLKYMIWYSVPYVGEESKAWNTFKDKFLRIHGETPGGRVGVLDPRFPDVREYLIGLYERTIRDWGFDGVKLDFIDQFVFTRDTPKDPVESTGMAGRDIRSLPEAVDELMRTILARLRKINQDVLVEFRQHYCGPAILQYGNMIRAADAPVDPGSNRRRICDLRLTSGRTAVHSDMIVWDRDETPEGAAQSVLSALYSVIQYSMVLDGIREDHKNVIRHWISFAREHRETLLKSQFRPYHPELGYPLVEAESASERIVTVYGMAGLIKASAEKPLYIVNATDKKEVPVDMQGTGFVEYYDVFGNFVSSRNIHAGVQVLEVPLSGYAKISRVEKKSASVPWTHQNFLDDPDDFTFAIIPDRTGGDHRGGWTNALLKANYLRPEFLMSIGDMIRGSWHSKESQLNQWLELRDMLSKVDCPFYSVVGNHDVSAPPRPGKGDEIINGIKVHPWEDSLSFWNKFNGPDYYSFIYKNVLFLCLNTMDSSDGVGMSEKQCNWMRSVLEKNSDVRWTMIFMHAPLQWTRPEWIKMEDEVLSKRKYTVFAGDWHTYLHVKRMGRDYYVLSVAGGCSEMGARQYDGRPKLWGPEWGEMDHLMWVVMTKDGPRVSNICVDGVLPGDYLNVLTTKSVGPSIVLDRPASPEIIKRIEDNKKAMEKRSGEFDMWAQRFGYRIDDATPCLEKAMASGYPRLVIDEQRGPWVVTKPIKVPSNTTVIIDNHVKFIRKSGVFPEGAPIFDTTGSTNAVIRVGTKVVDRF